jgi:hypothetical protein
LFPAKAGQTFQKLKCKVTERERSFLLQNPHEQ